MDDEERTLSRNVLGGLLQSILLRTDRSEESASGGGGGYYSEGGYINRDANMMQARVVFGRRGRLSFSLIVLWTLAVPEKQQKLSIEGLAVGSIRKQ